MKKRDLKKKILEAYRSEAPDLRVNILSSCMSEEQEPKTDAEESQSKKRTIQPSFRLAFKPLSAVALCLVLLVFGFAIGSNRSGGGGSVLTAETVVYLDVNPSIELQMDNENRIVDAIAGNKDAEIVLADLKLNGIDMNTALKAIVGSMYINGYLTPESNSMLISVNSKNEETADALLCDITEQINAALEKSNMECAIIAQCLTINEELTCKAEEYGISVGKMHLLNKISSCFGGISADTFAKLSNLSISDLNLIYLQVPNEGGENSHELISGTAKVNVTSEQALENVLAQIGKNKDEISNSCVFLRPSKSGDFKVAYGVYIKLPDDSNLYSYEVDCQSGEVFIVITFPTITADGVVYRDVLFSTDATTRP